ncbi:MAG: hypothetical protein JKY56_26120 [Kofleriaceae bacterium]|nr:hypothetical protein [Kofleriaceae bacterium]
MTERTVGLSLSVPRDKAGEPPEEVEANQSIDTPGFVEAGTFTSMSDKV